MKKKKSKVKRKKTKASSRKKGNKKAITAMKLVSCGTDKDRRLLVLETEFASPLQVMKREGNTLSPTLRQAWDGGVLRILSKKLPAKASKAHISVIGHITRDELRRDLTSSEAGNGFANRFLFMCVSRSKVLPEGGQLRKEDLTPLVERLRKAVAFARQAGELQRDAEAAAVWREVYPELSEGKPGLLGAVTSRAEAQVMRLATIYALLDSSPVIRKPHLLAALAVWDYAEASARFIFGDALGNPVADTLLRALRSSPEGLTRTEIRDLFGRNLPAQGVSSALRDLHALGLVRKIREDTGGRPTERWVVIRASVPTTIKTTKVQAGV